MPIKSFRPLNKFTSMGAKRLKKSKSLILVSLGITFLFEGSSLGLSSDDLTLSDMDPLTSVVHGLPKALPDFTNPHTQKAIRHEDILTRSKANESVTMEQILFDQPPLGQTNAVTARIDRKWIIQKYARHLDHASSLRLALEEPDNLPDTHDLSPNQAELAYLESHRAALFFLSMHSIKESEFNAWLKARDSFWKLTYCCCFFQ